MKAIRFKGQIDTVIDGAYVKNSRVILCESDEKRPTTNVMYLN